MYLMPNGILEILRSMVSINTLVRICKQPISWVVSYVGSQYEDSLTYIKNQTLSDADRRVELLDNRTEGSFRELCQAVVSLRLLFEVSENLRTRKRISNVSQFFNLQRRLGTRTVNEMMDIMSKRSMRRRRQMKLLDAGWPTGIVQLRRQRR